MAGTATIIFSVLAGLIAVAALYISLFGIPREWKRELEEQALKQMGENKASYLMKGMSRDPLERSENQISKLPADDQEDVKQLKQGLGNVLGGSMQNPLGKKVGDLGDDLSSPLTGR